MTTLAKLKALHEEMGTVSFGFRFFESPLSLIEDENPTRGYTLLPPL